METMACPLNTWGEWSLIMLQLCATVYIGQDSKWINFDSTFGHTESYLVYKGGGFVTEISSFKSCLHTPKTETVYDPSFLSTHRMVNFHHDCWTPSRFQRDLTFFGAQDIIILIL